MCLVDPRQPLSFTSAQSGDNYRDWWPHPVMTAFVSDSIDELDRLARATDNAFNMTRGGYVLATRRDDIDEMANALQPGIGVRILTGREVHERFPWLAVEIRHVVHIRRAGDIDGQQLGTYMLEEIRSRGGSLMRSEVSAIECDKHFVLTMADGSKLRADTIVNAAGPFAGHVAAMLGESLPVSNVFQQKLAFEDRLGAVPREMPFTIDLDARLLAWDTETRELLDADAGTRWLTRTLPGGTHCRPEGRGSWVKLGWAYNKRPSEPQADLVNEPASDPQFPEIVMRGAAAFLPALQRYVDDPPTRYSHYGGYYTMTDENWPLIGPMQTPGAYMVTALSGFGTMAACAAGKLCANWVCGGELPDYAAPLSTDRYDNAALMRDLQCTTDKGLL